jgi:hypothetical protein
MGWERDFQEGLDKLVRLALLFRGHVQTDVDSDHSTLLDRRGNARVHAFMSYR